MGSRSRYCRWLFKQPDNSKAWEGARRHWLVAEHDVRCSRSDWYTVGWAPTELDRFQRDAEHHLEHVIAIRDFTPEERRISQMLLYMGLAERGST